MSFFGGGVDKGTRAYNNAVRDYNTSVFDYHNYLQEANKANAVNALQYSQLGPESDIQYGTASGQYLNANPYINQVAGNVTQQIQDAYNKSTIPSALSSYAGSGRFGSGLFQKSLQDTQSQLNQDIANAQNQLYYQNYATERGYQENALSRLGQQYDPLARNATYTNILNAYQPSLQANPTASTDRGTFLGATTQGLLSGGISGALSAMGGW